MKKRKTAVLGLLLALVLAVLSGCHGTLEQKTATEPDAPETASKIPVALEEDKKIELNFWAKNDTNKVQTAVYTDAIEEFQKLYPNIQVNIRLYADYGRIFNDVITNIATDTTPNICITYPDHIATYLTGKDVMLPLDDWMDDPRFGLGGSELRFDSPKREEIAPKFLEECVIQGGTYALPYMRSTEALYINRDLVEKLGYEVPDVPTWDFVWEVSEKAMEKDENGLFKVNGQKVMIPFIYKSTDNMMITQLRQKDAGYSTEDGNVLIFNDTTAELLKEVYTHARSRAFSTFAISSYPGNFLNAGQCIFAVDSTAGATWMGSNAPMLDIHKEQVVPFTTAVRPVPQFNPETPLMISQGPSICVFNKKDPQEVLASWLFAQYMLTNKVQLAYAETEGYLPVTLKAQQSPEYQEYLGRKGENNQEYYDIKIEASELLMKHLNDTFVTPVFNGSASLRSAAGQLVENVCKGARRKEEMNDAYIRKQYSDVRNLFRLDQIKVTVPAAENTEPEETEQPPAGENPPAEEERKPEAEPGSGTGWGDLPAASQILLISLPVIWIAMGAFDFYRTKKSRRKN